MRKTFMAIAFAMSMSAFGQEIGDQVRSEVTNATKEATKEGAKAFVKALGNANWGVRANGLINASSLGNFGDVKELKNSGFNVGVSAKIDFTDSFFMNPELYYTKTATSQLDLPILFGYNIVKDRVAIVAGPSLMYSFSKESKNHAEKIITSGMTTGVDFVGMSSMFKFGYQAGIQVYFGNFLVSAKYDGTLSNQVVSLMNEGTGMKFDEKIKENFVSLGIGYNFGGGSDD